MVLATQCPHCQTMFRVANDQLKLRSGLVRCGSCKQIFNGVEHLLRPDAFTPAPASPPAETHEPTAAPAVSEPLESSPLSPPVEHHFPPLNIDHISVANSSEEATHPVVAQEESLPAAIEPERAAEESIEQSVFPPPEIEPTTESTIPAQADSIADQAPEQPESLPLEEEELPADQHQSQSELMAVASVPQAIEEPAPQQQDPALLIASETIEEHVEEAASVVAEGEQQPQPEIETATFAEDEPGFVVRSKRQERIGRVVRTLMAISVIFLALGGITQAAYIFRNQLAIRWPQSKPALIEMCRFLGCQVTLPTQIEVISVESSELQILSAAKNIYTLTILLRNQGAIVQAWPNIELTLNDADEKPLARRTLTPQDYLSTNQDVANGFAAKSEQPLKMYLEFQQLKASGYHVDLFYP